MQAYSNPEREDEPNALPDIEVFEMSASEIAASSMYEEEQWEFLKRHEFRLAGMNSRDCEKMLDAMVKEFGIKGGWFYWYCFPGCLPDSDPIGPFDTYVEALKDAQERAEDLSR